MSKVLEDVIVWIDSTYTWFKVQGYPIALSAPERENEVETGESLTASLFVASLSSAFLWLE